MTEYQKLYADRDPMELDEAGDYHSRHVFAMTVEGLHSKAAIAGELAYRDKLIDDLEAENAKLRDKLSRLHGTLTLKTLEWRRLADQHKDIASLSCAAEVECIVDQSIESEAEND